MKIRYSTKFRSRLESIADWIYERSASKQKAREYVGSIRSFLNDTLPNHPYAGRHVPEFGEGVRKIVYRSYSILYVVEGDGIVILTIYRENQP